MQHARLIDLCDDEEASTVLEDLDHDRRNVGVICDEPASTRYLGQSPASGEPFFSGIQLVEAKAWVAEENAKIRATFVDRDANDYFPDRESYGGSCASTGLKRVPREASHRSSTVADIDGDSRDDRFMSYSLGDHASGSYETRIRAELARGTVIDIQTERYETIDSHWGATDLDGNGRFEVWTSPNTNKPGAVSLIVFERCTIKKVGDETRFPLLMDTYGYFGSTDGVECIGDTIIETSFTPRVDNAFGDGRDVEEGWRFRAVRLMGARVVEVTARSGDDLDERPRQYSWRRGFNCV